ncbi:MAG TPA: DUF5916 domain-containing protein [Gemmatimonadales bacterium]|nr:DUF5916 domain-containing protein [Gemmatimonadales bacterium]
MPSALGVLLLVQASQIATPPPAVAGPLSIVAAARAERPPVLDGRDDDPIWSIAQPITAFREVRPSEDAEPKQQTMARIAYDERNLYVFVRAFDTHPDSIISLLSRRDVQTASDQIIIMVDPYRDRRTGYEFVVNPAGVKVDYAIYNDGTEDVAWDGVWDVATRIDSLGWTAEYRIPLSQLHYASGDSRSFGILIWRNIQRYTEQVSWPLYRTSHAGFVSQFGELTGLAHLARPARSELMPYLVTKSEPRPVGADLERHQSVDIGGDLRYRIASNLTLNATINPDFGQVEADPAVLNLTAFETFFDEKRPFFVEGRGLFNFDVDCSQVNCNGEGLFYSRRIGRSPQLADQYGDSTSAQATTILGAAKLTGRLPGGLSIGALDAFTQRTEGTGGVTLEPATNYSVLRLTQDYDSGNGSAGVMFTGVNRSLDQWSAPYLRSSGYVGALDLRRRFLEKRYEISASVDLSRVSGSPAAMLLTQTDPVHLYQRPDGSLRVDSSLTTLSGDAEEIHIGKVGGERTNWETSYLRRSPGFEINDLGFLLQSDQQSWNNWFGLKFNRPNGLWQRLNWNFNWWQYWTTAGLPTERAANTNFHMQLNDRWYVHAGGTLGQLGTTFCDRCARGGPALRQEPYLAPWFEVDGDSRRPLVPIFWLNYFRTDGGRTNTLALNPELDLKVSTRLATSLSANLHLNHYDAQWYDNFTDSLTGLTHYTFAHLDQKTLGLTWRFDFTFTPTLSLQLYAQPFVSKGTYTDVRELNQPRATQYADRFKPYADTSITNNPGGFNFKEFRSNLVFRWEYRPGSTIFLVWSQGREADDPREGTDSYFGDFRQLFSLRSQDTFLLKVSYWLSR